MNSYLIIGNLKKDRELDEDFEKILEEHLNYRENEVDLENLIISGLKDDGGGIGFYLGDDVKDFCDNDPLVLEGYLEYQITKFYPNLVNKNLIKLFIQ
ncbi:hypothetical protein [Peptoniphilus genitalis]|uniref:hypothetical protein n=1 Tax=Peptoniphilus genitalis TaxID=3036303 RepID=UPI0024AD44D5|nr:hypothetical protein [Peptoniphilus sp. Marseille-Q7072]